MKNFKAQYLQDLQAYNPYTSLPKPCWLLGSVYALLKPAGSKQHRKWAYTVFILQYNHLFYTLYIL